MSTDAFNAAFSSTEYTAAEKEKILLLRKAVTDLNLNEEQSEDDYLIKWLRARYLDLEKAEEMLRANIKWRRENQIDTILERETIPPEMEKMSPIAFSGISKEGYAAFIVPFGRHDVRACLEKYGVEALEMYNTIFFERMIKLMKEEGAKQGRKVTQIIEICDCEGYSYRQMATKQSRDFMTKMQVSMDAHYPEILRYAMMINAPKVFTLLFNMFKPFIPKATLDKIDIFSEPEKWKAVVAQKFPIQNIPPHWGGTLAGVDEYCSGDPIWIQGPADLKATMAGLTEEDSAFQKVEVGAREKFIQEVEVHDKGTIMEWKFKSEGHDIGFQLFYAKVARAKKEDIEDIIPLARVDAHTHVQEGSHVCEKPGIYSIVFDNRFSVLKSKTVLYQISFIDPAHQENPDLQ